LFQTEATDKKQDRVLTNLGLPRSVVCHPVL